MFFYKASSTTKEKNKQYKTHIQKEHQQRASETEQKEREKRHSGAAPRRAVGYLFDLIIIIYCVVGWFVGWLLSSSLSLSAFGFAFAFVVVDVIAIAAAVTSAGVGFGRGSLVRSLVASIT